LLYGFLQELRSKNNAATMMRLRTGIFPSSRCVPEQPMRASRAIRRAPQRHGRAVHQLGIPSPILHVRRLGQQEVETQMNADKQG
jgi:hypothetical protein